ncbi:MAG: hypothetical protein HPY84_01570 [Syntrophobacteraceae bacterium]|nr:hypothetical protein [Syntrophobacteraceae bacterium]
MKEMGFCFRKSSNLKLVRPSTLDAVIDRLGIRVGTSDRFVETLPFSENDTTAGSENELQTVVLGSRWNVDLPITIEASSYFSNVVRRIGRGETSPKAAVDLDRFLNENPRNVWENSWVRLPLHVLGPRTRDVLSVDLLADRRSPDGGLRADKERFFFIRKGDPWIRIPVSYLLKLSLADAVYSEDSLPASIVRTGERLFDHFLNDNTSPETFSFHVIVPRPGLRLGRSIAREASKRFLLTQVLAMYANERFLLRQSGQRVIIYFAPHPPVRQKELNDCISDAFYRELFMSPCLSGWARGETKHDYMCLCHQVLSRSQLNAVAKLREAGIITRNLVTLPNISNTSLANNGTHLSLGSLKLTRLLSDEHSPLNATDEKLAGDLVIKIVEHFLPLFVGTYSAAPYRIDFSDFHPEKLLGFLPHELDYTHLRMVWRRWKGKSRSKILGRPLTPFGPKWMDRFMTTLFRLQGDFVPDFRLLDYFVSLMSTERSPALDGKPGNGERLKKDLADLGIFDSRMALYLLYRLRECEVMGYSGFEGRMYSLFESMESDFGSAGEVQNLLNALAFKYIARGRVTHSHIPDSPFSESERRQIIFGTAIGLPTFFVRADSRNAFLQGIVRRCRRVRLSRRYPGYLRVYNIEYRRALVQTLFEDAEDLIEMFHMKDTLEELLSRIEYPATRSVAGRLTAAILEETGAKSAFDLNGKEFNMAAENHYRSALREKNIEEAVHFLVDDLRALKDEEFNEELRAMALDQFNLTEFLMNANSSLADECLHAADLRRLIHLLLLTIHRDMEESEAAIQARRKASSHETPVYRAVHE